MVHEEMDVNSMDASPRLQIHDQFEDMVINEFNIICKGEYNKDWDTYFENNQTKIIKEFLWDPTIPSLKYKKWIGNMIHDNLPHSPRNVIPCINGEHYILEYIQAYITNMIRLQNKLLYVERNTSYFTDISLEQAVLVSETDYISIDGVVHPQNNRKYILFGIVGGILLTYFYFRH